MRGLVGEKKGTFRDDLIYVALAVIGLGLLIYAGVKLYSYSFGSQEERAAKERLNALVEKIDGLEEGKDLSLQVQGVLGSKEKDKEWYLMGWGKNDGEKEGKPDRCFGKGCLCVCKGTIDFFGIISLSCNNKEIICKEVDYDNINIEGTRLVPRKDYTGGMNFPKIGNCDNIKILPSFSGLAKYDVKKVKQKPSSLSISYFDERSKLCNEFIGKTFEAYNQALKNFYGITTK